MKKLLLILMSLLVIACSPEEEPQIDITGQWLGYVTISGYEIAVKFNLEQHAMDIDGCLIMGLDTIWIMPLSYIKGDSVLMNMDYEQYVYNRYLYFKGLLTKDIISGYYTIGEISYTGTYNKRTEPFWIFKIE